MSAEPQGSRPSSGIPTLPASGQTSVFDIEPPVEPQLPSAGMAPPAPAPPVRRSGNLVVDGGAAAAKVAKKARRRRRRRDKVLGRAAIVVLLAGVAAAGYAGYESFRSEQDDERFTIDAETGNSVLIDADGARDVVGDTDDSTAPTTAAPRRLAQPLEIAALLPPDVDLIGRSLDPASGFTRYLVDADLAINAQRQGAGDWLASLRALPQSTAVGDASLVPALASGQLLIAYTSTNGVHVSRLVVVAPDYDIVIDAVAG